MEIFNWVSSTIECCSDSLRLCDATMSVGKAGAAGQRPHRQSAAEHWRRESHTHLTPEIPKPCNGCSGRSGCWRAAAASSGATSGARASAAARARSAARRGAWGRAGRRTTGARAGGARSCTTSVRFSVLFSCDTRPCSRLSCQFAALLVLPHDDAAASHVPCDAAVCILVPEPTL